MTAIIGGVLPSTSVWRLLLRGRADREPSSPRLAYSTYPGAIARSGASWARRREMKQPAARSSRVCPAVVIGGCRFTADGDLRSASEEEILNFRATFKRGVHNRCPANLTPRALEPGIIRASLPPRVPVSSDKLKFSREWRISRVRGKPAPCQSLGVLLLRC